MKVSAARKIAFDVLMRVEEGGAFASDLLHARLTEKVKREDAGLATELTLGVLRWRRLLDFLLEQFTKKPVTGFDLEVLLALRLGIYQIRFLERVPARAAVNESVELVKGARKSSAAPLVNAVLRRVAGNAAVAARGNCDKLLGPELAPAERLGILYSHPTWMVERWLGAFGEERTEALLAANNRRPRITCAVHPPERRGEIVRALEKENLSVDPGRLLRDAIVVHGGSPSRTEIFNQGGLSIQDEASQTPRAPRSPGYRRRRTGSRTRRMYRPRGLELLADAPRAGDRRAGSG